MELNEFYGPSLERMQQAEQQVLALIRRYQEADRQANLPDPVVYVCSRLKSPESMAQKLRQRGLPVRADTALTQVQDAVGVRVICGFLDDVYKAAAFLEDRPEVEVRKRKDYIAYPKPNGYRSLHLILRLHAGPGAGMTVEVQLRTIALDFWATLEHQLKYKQEIAHEALIRGELKRCADEIASVDLSMQTIRELLTESF